MTDDEIRRLHREARSDDPRARAALERAKRQRGLPSRAGARAVHRKARSVQKKLHGIDVSIDLGAENLMDSPVEEMFGAELEHLPVEIQDVQLRFGQPGRLCFEAARMMAAENLLRYLRDGDSVRSLVEEGTMTEECLGLTDEQALNLVIDALRHFTRLYGFPG